MDEKRVFGYCAECGEMITDDCEEYYITEDGRVFCSIECYLEYSGVTKVEV